MAKKQIRNIALLGLAALLVWQFSLRTYRNITYAAGGFRVHKINFSGIEFRMELTVTNRSDVPAPISAFIGQLQYVFPGQPPTVSILGDLTQVAPVNLPGFGQAVVEFSMKSGLFGGALEVMKILTNGNPLDLGKINYNNVDMKRFQIDGTLKIGALPIDIKTTLA